MIVGHKAPHSFYTPEPKYARTFDAVPVSYPASAFALDDKPAWIKDRLRTWHGIYGPLFEWRKKFPDDRPEAAEDGEEGLGDECFLGERFEAGGEGVRAIAAELAVGEREGLLRHDAFVAPVAFQHVGVVEGGEEAVLHIGGLDEVE